MRFERTPIDGLWVLEQEAHRDDRGYFARFWCADELSAHGCDPRLAQCSVSHNARRGTLRGLHWQTEPHSEAKTVMVTRGAIWDVAVDLRESSPTYGKWFGITLPSRERAIHIPAGCAHGFITLDDDTQVEYLISVPHHAESARGLAWDDPTIAIRWPERPSVISARDGSLPRLK